MSRATGANYAAAPGLQPSALHWGDFVHPAMTPLRGRSGRWAMDLDLRWSSCLRRRCLHSASGFQRRRSHRTLRWRPHLHWSLLRNCRGLAYERVQATPRQGRGVIVKHFNAPLDILATGQCVHMWIFKSMIERRLFDLCNLPPPHRTRQRLPREDKTFNL